MKPEEVEKKILEWHKIVVFGLCNGLSFTNRDGRTKELDFWRTRSTLFDRFSHCVLDLITNQSYKLDEKELKQIAKDGYK